MQNSFVVALTFYQLGLVSTNFVVAEKKSLVVLEICLFCAQRITYCIFTCYRYNANSFHPCLVIYNPQLITSLSLFITGKQSDELSFAFIIGKRKGWQHQLLLCSLLFHHMHTFVHTEDLSIQDYFSPLANGHKALTTMNPNVIY